MIQKSWLNYSPLNSKKMTFDEKACNDDHLKLLSDPTNSTSVVQ